MTNIINYMTIPSIGGSKPMIKISKDNGSVLYNSNDTGKQNLYLQSIENPEKRRRVTKAEFMIYKAKFAPFKKQICYLVDEHGSEKHDLFLADLDDPDKEHKKITNRTLMTYPNGFDWHPQGDRIIRSFTDQDNSGLELINLQTGEVSILVENTPPLMSVAFSHSGEWIACTAYDKTSQILLINTQNPDNRKKISLNETCYNASPSWSADDKKLGFITNIHGFFQPVIYDLEEEKAHFIPLQDKEESIAFSQVALEIIFHKESEKIYYGTGIGGRNYIMEYDLKTKSTRTIPFPEGSIQAFDLSAGSRYIAAVHSSMKSPGMAYVYDLVKDSLIQVSNNPFAEMLEKLPAPESLLIPSYDGRKVHSWYLKNCRENGKPAPAIIVPHGGPSENTSDEWFQGLYFQAFVMAGFSVIVPNYRGSTGYGDEFFKLNVGDVGGGDLEDIMAAYKWLREQPDIDPARIGILGASYGGYLTLMALGKYPQAFKAGVSVVPAVDWAYQYEVSDKKFKNYIRYLLDGTPQEKAQLYKERSALYRAEQIKSPLLVIAGANDYRCPLKPIQDLEKIVNQNGVKNEFIIKGLDGHMSLFDDVEEQIKDLFKMIEFLKENM